jgi:hypothetical protein
MRIRKFTTGQSVAFLDNDLRLRPLGSFTIVRTLPEEHGIFLYRIKSLTDGHERVVMESEVS